MRNDAVSCNPLVRAGFAQVLQLGEQVEQGLQFKNCKHQFSHVLQICAWVKSKTDRYLWVPEDCASALQCPSDDCLPHNSDSNDRLRTTFKNFLRNLNFLNLEICFNILFFIVSTSITAFPFFIPMIFSLYF